MKYALIDNDGQLHMRTGGWESELGPEGFDRVGLHPSLPMAGWVNGSGLTMPQTYPRNPIGSAVLACLGAALRPYAGPVVITGFHHCAACEPDATDLHLWSMDYLPRLHCDIVRALDGKAPVKEAEKIGPEWGEFVRRYAQLVRTADAPTMRVGDFGKPRGFGGPD